MNYNQMLVDLFEPQEQELPGETLPWQTEESAQTLSQRIQQWLGASEPNQGGMAEDILSKRFDTSYGDYAQGVINSALGKPSFGPQVANQRIAGELQKITALSQLQQQPKLQSVSPGQKLVNPATGEVVFDAGPQEITPYQREYLGIQRERNNLSQSGSGKPPTGYRWLPDGSLEPIPGGPGTAISAELSARLGLANKFLNESEGLKQQVRQGTATGPLDYMYGAAGYGDSGKIQRRVADGADALQRMLTGAGMPPNEANDYANRFRVTSLDTSETLYDKLVNLENVLRAQIEMSTRGRGFVSKEAQPNDSNNNGWSIERVE